MKTNRAEKLEPGGSPPSSLAARLHILTTLPPDRLQSLLAGDPARAAPWVHAAAQMGLPEGQVRYGRMLLDGAGVRRNESAAYDWFRRAAEGGDPEAQNMVGRCLENGWGVTVDPAEAARWFARAADQGHAWARYNLGHLHLDGLGVDRDRNRAFALYRQAAEAGHVRAMNLLARCFEEGWGVEPDAALARQWCRRSAEGGYFRGQYNFATILLQEGRPTEAATWFESALDGAPSASRKVMAAQLAASAAPTLQRIAKRALDGRAAAPDHAVA